MDYKASGNQLYQRNKLGVVYNCDFTCLPVYTDLVSKKKKACIGNNYINAR